MLTKIHKKIAHPITKQRNSTDQLLMFDLIFSFFYGENYQRGWYKRKRHTKNHLCSKSTGCASKFLISYVFFNGETVTPIYTSEDPIMFLIIA